MHRLLISYGEQSIRPKAKYQSNQDFMNNNSNYMFAWLVNKNVSSIRFQVMSKTGTKDILVTNSESLHEDVFHIFTFVF